MSTRPLSGRLVALMAVATGAIVANLYYAQPLLHQIAASFHAGTTATSIVVTATQVGYAAALLFVVPLGDVHPRRTLVVGIFLVAVVTLVWCAASPFLWLFEVAAVATGVASVAGQIMIPFAADLATPERRGRVVARMMTGLLVGILLARTVSGIVTQAAGWRAIYWLSAALMAVFAVVLHRALPAERPRPHVPYGRLVTTTLRLFVDEPVLRRRAWYGAATFAAFSVLWTSLAFLLSGPPYRYSNLVIGLFGLAGVGGMMAANVAGRFADTTRTGLSTVVAALVTTGAFGLLAAGKTSLGFLLAGIVLLDIGSQGMHITNQAVIYSHLPEARSRMNSAYMTTYFVGGAAGSVTAGAALAAGGWDAVCVLGAGFGALAMALWVTDRVRLDHRAPGPVARSTGESPGPQSTLGSSRLCRRG